MAKDFVMYGAFGGFNYESNLFEYITNLFQIICLTLEWTHASTAVSNICDIPSFHLVMVSFVSLEQISIVKLKVSLHVIKIKSLFLF